MRCEPINPAPPVTRTLARALVCYLRPGNPLPPSNRCVEFAEELPPDNFGFNRFHNKVLESCRRIMSYCGRSRQIVFGSPTLILTFPWKFTCCLVSHGHPSVQTVMTF